MLITANPYLKKYLPKAVSSLTDPKTEIPRIAKDKILLMQIDAAVCQIPTRHDLFRTDSRNMSFIPDKSIHLVVTSPPYWTLKKYRDHEDQLGDINDYESS